LKTDLPIACYGEFIHLPNHAHQDSSEPSSGLDSDLKELSLSSIPGLRQGGPRPKSKVHVDADRFQNVRQNWRCSMVLDRVRVKKFESKCQTRGSNPFVLGKTPEGKLIVV
jgi:hypothetical protein